jgi:threonylcarbamoyladenosine tRNA methylthiotransferase MtaB
MLRRTSQASFSALVSAARDVAPDMAITTDIIVGFPGETEADFEESAAFVETMNFAGLHVFPYSQRAGTPAARMKGHVRSEIKNERVARLLSHHRTQSEKFARQFREQIRPVLWEHVAGATQDGFVNVGYTDNYVRVGCIHPRPLTGTITAAALGEYDPSRAQVEVIPMLEPI